MSTETITKVPVHISMIMDGNGRWAKERGKERVYGHFEGVESVRACVEAALEHGVKYLSVFAHGKHKLVFVRQPLSNRNPLLDCYTIGNKVVSNLIHNEWQATSVILDKHFIK